MPAARGSRGREKTADVRRARAQKALVAAKVRVRMTDEG
jgi:hypothetical protein